jgi:NAD-reducing hydrogenase small subunit
MSKIKLATAWLDGCSGCHMSVLDIDEAIAVVAQNADMVYGPLVDAQEFPEGVDVAIVEGAVSSQDDLKLIQTIRKRSKMLISLGDCAVTSNVPAMRNLIPVKQILDRVYIKGATAHPGIPNEGVPPLLRNAVPIHEVVKVDLHVPGCPPPAPVILQVLSDLFNGRKPDFATKVKFG